MRASRGRTVKCAIDIATKKLPNGTEISEGSSACDALALAHVK